MSEKLATLLGEAIGHLLMTRHPQGHWGDVRATSLAAWAFAEVLSCRNASCTPLPELQAALADAQAWLAGQSKKEEGGVSWESEAWDTALAVISLSGNEKYNDHVDQAAAWLQMIRDPGTGVWYEEVWETTLATVALLRAEKNRKLPAHDQGRWLEAVLSWLHQIPSKPSGEFVCPHYSGFIAWLLGEIKASRLTKRLQSTGTFGQFSGRVTEAVQFLLNNVTDSGLWSSYTFSNAYIAYGLTMFSRFYRVDAKYADLFELWLEDHQGRCGGFEDIEDTALAVLALASILDSKAERSILLEQVARSIPRPTGGLQKCFFGYSGKAEILALRIKDALSHMLPTLQIKDWRWDFQMGRVLFDEIESASRECQIALFLVTKDDILVQSRRKLAPLPRDNVVFEVGFFAARLGMENTILIVESGTKIPADWGGILYIPLKSRTDLSPVILRVVNAIKKQLRL